MAGYGSTQPKASGFESLRVDLGAQVGDGHAAFDALFERAPVMLLLLDAEGRVCKANGLARQQLTGRNAEGEPLPVGNAVRCLYALESAGGCGATPVCETCPVHRIVDDALRTGISHLAEEVTLPLQVGSVAENRHFLLSASALDLGRGRELLVAVQDITSRKEAEKRNHLNSEIQRTVGNILRLALQPVSLEEVFERTLEELFSVSWLGLESKGCVFVVEEDPAVLVMKVQKGLPKDLLGNCANVPFGDCLCGQAATTGGIVFASAVDERHSRRLPLIEPHGHYCVPIKSGDEVCGVLCLYVPTDHKKKPEEEVFLASVADCLAATIKRKRMEQSLRESEERFDLAVRGTDAGIWDWDLRTNNVYFSPRWKSMLGYTEDEITHDFGEWEKRLHPEDRDRATVAIRDYLDGRTSDYELEHRLRHKDGSYRWILSRGAAVRDSEGNAYRVVGSHLDITDRKQMEERLRSREAALIAAQQIQRHLLPQAPPRLEGFDVEDIFVPAEFAAGDHFDYLPMPDGRLGIVVGDVSGHGIGPALVMASAHAHIRSLSAVSSDLSQVLSRTNTALARETEEGRFVTLILACLDPAAGTIEYVNAGHPSGYVLDRSGEIKATLRSGGLPLGIEEHAEFPTSDPIKVDRGDVVLLLTDGILEALSPGGELFGTERTLAVVRESRNCSAREIVDNVHLAVREFSKRERQNDDLTAVVIKVETTDE